MHDEVSITRLGSVALTELDADHEEPTIEPQPVPSDLRSLLFGGGMIVATALAVVFMCTVPDVTPEAEASTASAAMVEPMQPVVEAAPAPVPAVECARTEKQPEAQPVVEKKLEPRPKKPKAVKSKRRAKRFDETVTLNPFET